MNITPKRTGIILDALMDHPHYAELCPEYGERGYSAPEGGILFCNWNNVSKRVCAYLEEAGYELEWSDEWYVDYDNGKAWRTSPDSYSWVCAIRYTEHGVLTPDDPIEDWITDTEMTDHGHTPSALPDWITEEDLIEQGYERHNGRFESGFYPGQNDDPKEVAKLMFSELDAEAVVFRIEGCGQFDLHWQAWFRRAEEQAAA